MKKTKMLCGQSASPSHSTDLLSELKELLAADPQLKPLGKKEKYLERFLYATDFDAPKALDKIKRFYDLLLKHPDWMCSDQPEDHRELILKEIKMVLPGTDKTGRPIYLMKLGKVDTSRMELRDAVAVDDIWLELIFQRPASRKGLCVIVDIKDYSWRMMKWLTPHNIKLAILKIQTLPFKDYSIHVVNNSLLVHGGIKIVWPFVPEWLKAMVKFHFDDWESLYDYIDREVLPREYGGTDTTISYEDLCDDLLKMNDVIAGSFKDHRRLPLTCNDSA